MEESGGEAMCCKPIAYVHIGWLAGDMTLLSRGIERPPTGQGYVYLILCLGYSVQSLRSNGMRLANVAGNIRPIISRKCSNLIGQNSLSMV